MTQLKTLRELIEESPEGLNRVSGMDLRAEAIKWSELSDYDLYELGFDKSDNSDDLRKWIKHFFNITDEELK